MITIVDYGTGNLHSVQKALEYSGAKTSIINRPEEIKTSDKLVLPGVGAFNDAISELKKRDMVSAINDHINKGKLFLGICLGMQLLFERSEEASDQGGLGVLKGEVKRFGNNIDFKVPHIGWNQIDIRRKDCPLLKNLPNSSNFYFCHSYYVEPLDKNLIAANTNYGIDFTSVICKDNLYAVQFHPEKSQEIGVKMLRNFVEM